MTKKILIHVFSNLIILGQTHQELNPGIRSSPCFMEKSEGVDLCY